MDWLNTRTSLLHAREYISASPVQRATWWNVLLWSAAQDNSGRIVGANRFNDRQWQQTCGVTKREVSLAAPLLVMDGDDLIVWNYPLEKQNEVAAKRENARRNGVLGGRPPRTRGSVPLRVLDEPLEHVGNSLNEPAAVSMSEPMLVPASVPIAEPKLVLNPEPMLESGRGKEEERKHAAHAREGARALPESLDSPDFRQAWEAWLQHWAETFRRGSPMPSGTSDSHLRLLAAMGLPRAIAAIANSISRGLREPAEAFTSKNENNRASPAAQSRRCALGGDYTGAGF